MLLLFVVRSQANVCCGALNLQHKFTIMLPSLFFSEKSVKISTHPINCPVAAAAAPLSARGERGALFLFNSDKHLQQYTDVN